MCERSKSPVKNLRDLDFNYCLFSYSYINFKPNNGDKQGYIKQMTKTKDSRYYLILDNNSQVIDIWLLKRCQSIIWLITLTDLLLNALLNHVNSICPELFLGCINLTLLSTSRSHESVYASIITDSRALCRILGNSVFDRKGVNEKKCFFFPPVHPDECLHPWLLLPLLVAYN